jgi:DNA repair protein RecO (recombination protein O)
MPVERDEAFVLARYPFRERDFVVALLTRLHGQVRVVARRARGLRSKRAAALEPLARVRVSYFERAGAEMGTLDEAEAVRPSFPLAANPVGWAAGQVVAELALVYAQPGQRAEAAFRLVDRCIECLLAGHDAAAVAHYAELWFLRLGGVFPELDRCGVCGARLGAGTRAYDPQERAFVCAEHRSGRTLTSLSAAGVEWLRRALQQRLEDVRSPAPAETAAWLVALREHFTEREVRAWRYLHHLLAGDQPA